MDGRISPDGHWLAYVSDESGKWEVYVQPFLSPGGKWQISSNGGKQPEWSRDGKELFYVAADRNLMAVAVRPGLSLDPGTPKQLFQFHGTSDFLCGSYDVGADGQRFLVSALVGEEASPPLTVDISPELLVESAKTGGIKIKATEIPFLSSLGEQAKNIAQILADLKLQILISPPAVGFILTDNPFTIVPSRTDKRVGIVNFGTYTYIPLTRTICLRYGMTGRNEFYLLEREDVRLTNQNLAVNSERFVMGPSGQQIESVVRRSESTTMDPSPRFVLDKFVDTDGGIIQQLTQLQRRRYFYPDSP